MIKVTYSDGTVEESRSIEKARFLFRNKLFATHGKVTAIKAVEVFGVTSKGIVVEMDLIVKFGTIEFPSGSKL